MATRDIDNDNTDGYAIEEEEYSRVTMAERENVDTSSSEEDHSELEDSPRTDMEAAAINDSLVAAAFMPGRIDSPPPRIHVEATNPDWSSLVGPNGFERGGEGGRYIEGASLEASLEADYPELEDSPRDGIEATARNHSFAAAAPMSDRGDSPPPSIEVGATTQDGFLSDAPNGNERGRDIEVASMEVYREIEDSAPDGMEVAARNDSLFAAAPMPEVGELEDESYRPGFTVGTASHDSLALAAPTGRLEMNDLSRARSASREEGHLLGNHNRPPFVLGSTPEEPSIRLEDWDELSQLLLSLDCDVSQTPLSWIGIGDWLRSRGVPEEFVEDLDQFLDANLSLGDGNVLSNVADCILHFFNEKHDVLPKGCEILYGVCESYHSSHAKVTSKPNLSRKSEESKPTQKKKVPRKARRRPYKCGFCGKPKITYRNGIPIPHGTCPKHKRLDPYPGDDGRNFEGLRTLTPTKKGLRDENEGVGDSNQRDEADEDRKPAAVVRASQKRFPRRRESSEQLERPRDRVLPFSTERLSESRANSDPGFTMEFESTTNSEQQQQQQRRLRRRLRRRQVHGSAISSNDRNSNGDDGNNDNAREDDNGDEDDDIYKDVRRHSV